MRLSILTLIMTVVASGVSEAATLRADAATTCKTVAACLLGDNTANGIGVQGESISGDGISGKSLSSHGVLGISTSSFGVEGITTENSTSSATARAGVYGHDISTNRSIYNTGIGGLSSYGIGALGETATGVAVEGLAVSNSGYITRPKYSSIGVYGDADQGPGVYGYAHGSTSDSYGLGAYADQAGITSLFSEAAGDGGSTFFARTHADGYLMVGASFERGNVLSIDGMGNEILAGTLTQNGTSLFRTRSSAGSDVMTFGSRSSAPTIEDCGEAQITNGSGYVAIERTFRGAIDQRLKYLVFVTPEGDSRGLYVSTQTSRGFAVRENESGRSTVAFNYRIVAKPFDSAATRLAPFADHLAKPAHVPNRPSPVKEAL